MTQYLKLSNLTFSDNLVNTIGQLSWQDMTPVFDVSPAFYLAHVFEFCWKNKVMPWPFFNKGWFGRLLSYKFPQHIEEAILSELYSQAKKIKEVPIIRLQVIYGGSHVAVHTDPTRSVSLVYPISNHDVAHTTFYNGPITPGIVNPADCTVLDSVVIADAPVMFEVDKPHSVDYASGTLTKQNPRISLSIKWQYSSFEQVAKHFIY